MGYDYAFLIVGQEQETKLDKELFYTRSSGSYMCSDNHWFFQNMENGSPIEYTGPAKLEQIQHVFDFDNLKDALQELVIIQSFKHLQDSALALCDELQEYKRIQAHDNCRKAVCTRWYALSQSFQEWNENCKARFETEPASEEAYQELKLYVEKLQEFATEGFQNVRVIYSFTP